jgi:hypothetical protein
MRPKSAKGLPEDIEDYAHAIFDYTGIGSARFPRWVPTLEPVREMRYRTSHIKPKPSNPSPQTQALQTEDLSPKTSRPVPA